MVRWNLKMLKKKKQRKSSGKKAKKESMFDDISDDMLISEEIEGTSLEEAEVVMAVRALADDIQDLRRKIRQNG